MNRYEQFADEVDGQRIHFLHVRSPHAGAIPLFLTHGWPGSLVEFLDVIDPLTDPADPADAFHVVVPSLPGYGFSGPTTRRAGIRGGSPPPSARSPTGSATSATASRAATGARSSPTTWPNCAPSGSSACTST